MKQSDDELIAKLRRERQFRLAEGGMVHKSLANPDGPEASDRLSQQREEIERLREELTDAREMLVHFRREAPLDCQPAAGVMENLLTEIDAALKEQDHGK